MSTSGFVKVVAAIALAVAISPSAGASELGFCHRCINRGDVVKRDDKDVYVCIGAPDAAKVGQELSVYHERQVPAGPKGGIRLMRKKVGRIRIDEVVEEKYARATVVDGDVKRGDYVKLKPED